MTDLDTLRADNPDLGFAVYAYEPGKPVTLEIHAADGIYPFTGATLAEAIGKAFPESTLVDMGLEPDDPPAASIFD